MATKSSTKTKPADTEKKTSSKRTAVKHDLLYIMSPSCGWCTKATPVVDELRKDGYTITQLDVNHPDESKRANEVKDKYNVQCGTPWFINAETGKGVCGVREKDVLEKWANGEEIPAPPRPKSPPPPPPQNFDDGNEVNVWKEKYGEWCKENDHLPKLLPADEVLQRMRQAQQQRQMQGAPGDPGAPGVPGGAPVSNNPSTAVVKNTQFYYIVEGGQRSAVMADANFVNSLKQQYYVRESDGKLTKVTGDTTWKSGNTNPAAPTTQRPTTPVNAPAKRVVDSKVKAQIQKSKVAAVKKDKKSKENKKTIKSF